MAHLALLKKVIKKMATEGGSIDFMFLGPPYPAAGSATEILSGVFQQCRIQDIPEGHQTGALTYYLA